MSDSYFYKHFFREFKGNYAEDQAVFGHIQIISRPYPVRVHPYKCVLFYINDSKMNNNDSFTLYYKRTIPLWPMM